MKPLIKSNLTQKLYSILVALFVAAIVVAITPFAHLFFQIIFTDVDINAIKSSMANGDYNPIITTAFTVTAIALNYKGKEKYSR
jgi:hypothetical protein